MHVNFKMYSHIYEPFIIHNVNSNHWWKSKIKLPKMINIIAQQIGAQNINFLRWHMDLCRGWEVAIYRKLTCGYKIYKCGSRMSWVSSMCFIVRFILFSFFSKILFYQRIWFCCKEVKRWIEWYFIWHTSWLPHFLWVMNEG